jgi:hypothetical protein
MKAVRSRSKQASLRPGRRLAGFVIAVSLLAAATPAYSQSPPAATGDDGVSALALQWFAAMQTGQIDRSQLAPDYSAHLTDSTVKETAQYLKDHAYGASPVGTQIVRTRTIGEQKFYVVKIVFPRGDAASLLLGLDAAGKITGISLMSMAGD